MALLSCVFYKGYYFFFAYWIIELIRTTLCRILLKVLDVTNSNGNEDFSLEEELLNLILLNISDLLNGFLVLYTNIKMKPLKKKKHKIENKNIKKLDTILIYNDFSYSTNYNYKYKYIFIILISFVDFIAKSVDFFSALVNVKSLKSRQVDWMLSIDIIVRHIFSVKLLKLKVGRHHNLSIILCMIGFLLMWFSDIKTIMNSKKKNRDIIIYLIIFLPKTILFPLEDTFNKILLTNDFLLPHSLIFLRGIFELVIILISIALLHFKNTINYEYYKKLKIRKISYFYFILFTFLTSIRNLCLMNVIYIFNSNHISFLLAIKIFDNTIRQFLEENIIYDLGKKKGIVHFSIDIIALILISLGSLIFNEIIVINACGLNEKTKPGLLFLEKIDNFDNLDSLYYADEDEKEEEKINEIRNESIQRIQPSNNIQNDIFSPYKENEEVDDSF